MFSTLTDRLWKRILWIAALALLAYLPAALQLTYYRDDWYYAYDAMVGPAGVFRFMFSEDRPARGLFFEIYHALFGMAPTPYHLAMLFWRIAGGAAAAWLFHLLWPRRSMAGLAAGVLFALYPGFTWWVQGIEYQPMVVSAALMVVSFCLTVLGLRVKDLWPRVLCMAGAILAGWLYLALVEYAAGMEVFRLVLIFFAVEAPNLRTLRARAVAALRHELPYLIIPAGFLLWRFVFFTSERRATDLGAQLSALFTDPLATGLRWLMSFLLSFINVTLSAWVQPLLNNFFSGSLREQGLGLLLAISAGVVGWLLVRRDEPTGVARMVGSGSDWALEAVWLGLAGIVLGIAPVIAANRQISFPSFSHYSLPASLGVVLVVAGLISLLANRAIQATAFSVLILLSTLTHHGLGAAALREERTIAGFWQQMSWRAPSLDPGTTLFVEYAGIDYGTDSDVVWGPANFLYYPGAQAELPVRVQLAALTADKNTINSVIVGRDTLESTYRAHTMNIDYGKVLIAVQSATDACVRVFDPRWEMYSTADAAHVRLLGSSSRVDTIRTSAAAPELSVDLFGPEPAPGWCYYFELASLAAQPGDWERVGAIQDEIGKLGLHPNDQIEWMPFLLAQAGLGDLQAMKEIATRINTEKLYKQQACRNLAAMPEQGFALPPESQAYAAELFCGGSQ
jgi:hypothetical protein